MKFRIQSIYEGLPEKASISTKASIGQVVSSLHLSRSEQRKLERHTVARLKAGLDPIPTVYERGLYFHRIVAVDFGQNVASNTPPATRES